MEKIFYRKSSKLDYEKTIADKLLLVRSIENAFLKPIVNKNMHGVKCRIAYSHCYFCISLDSDENFKAIINNVKYDGDKQYKKYFETPKNKFILNIKINNHQNEKIIFDVKNDIK